MVSSEASPLLVLHQVRRRFPTSDQISESRLFTARSHFVAAHLEAILLTLKSTSAIPEHPLGHPSL